MVISIKVKGKDGKDDVVLLGKKSELGLSNSFVHGETHELDDSLCIYFPFHMEREEIETIKEQLRKMGIYFEGMTVMCG